MQLSIRAHRRRRGTGYGYDGRSWSETVAGGTFTTYICVYHPNIPSPPMWIFEPNNSLLAKQPSEHVSGETFNMTGIGRVRTTVGYGVLPDLLVYISGGWSFRAPTRRLGGLSQCRHRRAIPHQRHSLRFRHPAIRSSAGGTLALAANTPVHSQFDRAGGVYL